MAVKRYAAGDVRVALWITTLFRGKELSPRFLNESAFLPRILAKREAIPKTSLPQSVLNTLEVLLFFHSIG